MLNSPHVPMEPVHVINHRVSHKEQVILHGLAQAEVQHTLLITGAILEAPPFLQKLTVQSCGQEEAKEGCSSRLTLDDVGASEILSVHIPLIRFGTIAALLYMCRTEGHAKSRSDFGDAGCLTHNSARI